MVVCAEAILNGELVDPVGPDDVKRPLFVRGNIPNHGVLGRMGAAGYLQRVATELELRQLDAGEVALAAGNMQTSSDLFRKLRYEENIKKAGKILARIAEHEMSALSAMETAWQTVRQITSNQVNSSDKSTTSADAHGVAAE